MLRTAAAVEAVCGDGWERSRPRWRLAVDTAAAAGTSARWRSRCAPPRPSPTTSGSRPDAEALYAAAPRATAITVLPALFPESTAALAATTTCVPRPLVDALAAARDVLGGSAAPARGPPPPAATGELAVEGDGWRVTFDGRTVRVRDMKGIGDLAVLVARPGVEVHALELMGGGVVEGRPARRSTSGPGGSTRRASSSCSATSTRPATTTITGGPSGPRSSSTPWSPSCPRRSASAAGPGRPARARSGPGPRSPTGCGRRSRRSASCTPSSGATSPTPCAPGRGARTGPRRDIDWTVDLTV